MHVKPGKGAAFVRTKLKNSITSNTIDKTFRAGETVASATVEKKDSQFTYADGNEVKLPVPVMLMCQRSFHVLSPYLDHKACA